MAGSNKSRREVLSTYDEQKLSITYRQTSHIN